MHEDIFENIEYLIIRGQNQFKEFIQESLILIKKLIDIVNSNNLQLAGKEKIQKQKESNLMAPMVWELKSTYEFRN